MSRSGIDFSAGLTTQNMNLHRNGGSPNLKTWCYKAAIARVLRDCPDPEVMDALFGVTPPRTKRQQGRPKKALGGDL
jgi:hypothetical protein